MDSSDAIIAALGLQGVELVDSKLYKKDLRAEFVVRQKRSECFCRHCGLQFDRVKEWDVRELRAPPFGIYAQVTVKFRQMRGWCEGCAKSAAARPDWIHPKFESMTCSLAEHAGRLMEEVTCEAAARLLCLPSKTAWAIDQNRMETMLQFMRLPSDLDVSELCADEVHFRTRAEKVRKGPFAKRGTPLFATNVIAPKAGKVLFNAMGRDELALRGALRVLSPGQKLAVEWFALDMHEPFMAAARAECPNAKICVDRFHLAQKANEAFDAVRKAEFAFARKHKNLFEQGMLEPHRRFVLVSRDAELSKSETRMLEKLRKINQPINDALLLLESFHRCLDRKTVKGFRKAFVEWLRLAHEAQLKPFIKFANLVWRYRAEVRAYVASRLTTAVAEGLNNKIKVLKRMDYGYSRPTSFLRKILQRCGYLNSRSINTNEFYFRWPKPPKTAANFQTN